MESNETIGSKILSLRKEKGLTQADLGAHLNISYQAVSKWERDESCPDFITLSRIAQLFGVPISYFEDTAEVAAANAAAATPTPTATTAQPTEEKQMLGVCKDCGKVVHEGEEGLKEPVLVCKECLKRRRKIQEQKAAEAKRAQEKKREEEMLKAAQERERIAKCRRRGFIFGSLLAAAFILIGVIGAISNRDASALPVFFVLAFFGFTWGTQMFWDGWVVDTTFFGGKHIGTPGIIFDFDLDGFIFLIVMKLLFAILRLLVFVVTTLFFVVVAVVGSPFTFFPALHRVNSGDFT